MFRWTGTLALGGYLVARADLSTTGSVLAGTAPLWLGCAIALYVLDRLAAALKWRLLFVAQGHQLPFGRALQVYLQSSFLGAALPATIGMDLIRARFVTRYGGTFAYGLTSVVVERALGIVALVVCAVLGLLILGPDLSRAVAGPLLAVAIGSVAVLGLLVLCPPLSDTWRVRFGGPAGRLVRFVAEVHERLRSYSSRPAVLTLAFLIALAQQYLLTVITWIAALALGLAVPLTAMLWIWPLVMIGIRLPISVLGFGVREFMLFELFARNGYSAHAAVSLGLLSGGLDLLFIGMGGLLVLADRGALVSTAPGASGGR